MKKALIHDWYYVDGGAEKVIKSILGIWNDFDHYALVDFLNDQDRNIILKGNNVKTSFIQNLPTAKSNHRKFLQLFPYAVESFNLSEFDLVISSSASVAKGVLTNQNQLHISYCHSPMRYAWDLYHHYLNESGLNVGVKGIYAKYVLNKMRAWDVISSNRVDHFVANSRYIANRIKKVYNRDADVIYPPVDTQSFTLQNNKEDYYFTASRMVPYKKIDLIVKSFNEMPNKKLIVAGSGPDFKKIAKLAKKNIKVLGFVSEEEMKTYMQSAKAFVFAAEEDFGIVPVEAQACGTPVIGYGKGGLRETVINGVTGIHFEYQTVNSIINAVKVFENRTFDYAEIRRHAETFSRARFEKEFKAYVDEKYEDFSQNKS